MGMDPATMLLVGKMAGSGMSILGSMNDAKNAKKVAKYQRRQAEADGSAALGAANVEANKIRQAASGVQSQAVSASADSGVVVGDGSAGLAEKSIRQRAEQDALMTIFDGQDSFRRALAQGQSYKIQGQEGADAAFADGLGSMINFGVAGAGLISKWLKGNSKGTGK